MKLNQEDRIQAEAVIKTSIFRCGKMIPKFQPGTSQHSLLINRIQALKTAEILISGGKLPEDLTLSALNQAQEPLASIIRKCRKAQSKYDPGSRNYERFQPLITTMTLALELIQAEITELKEQPKSI